MHVTPHCNYIFIIINEIKSYLKKLLQKNLTSKNKNKKEIMNINSITNTHAS